MKMERWNIPEKEKNVTELETPNALYKIIYGVHELEQSPEVIKNSDGLIVEAVGDFSSQEKVEKFLENVKKIPQHAKLVDYFRTENKSLYLVDLNALAMFYEQRADSLNFLETIGGAGLAIWGMKDYVDEKTKTLRQRNSHSPEDMTRRDFLKKIGTGAKIAGSAYLLSPIAGEKFGQLVSQPQEDTIMRKIDKKIIAANETIHPEIYNTLLTFRNYLIAQKAEYIAQQKFKETQDKPELSILIGAAHTGIESALTMNNDERMKLLKENIAEDNRLKQSSIVKIDFDNDEAIATFMEEENIKNL